MPQGDRALDRRAAGAGGAAVVAFDVCKQLTSVPYPFPEEAWLEMIDVNLTGVWRTVSAATGVRS